MGYPAAYRPGAGGYGSGVPGFQGMPTFPTLPPTPGNIAALVAAIFLGMVLSSLKNPQEFDKVTPRRYPPGVMPLPDLMPPQEGEWPAGPLPVSGWTLVNACMPPRYVCGPDYVQGVASCLGGQAGDCGEYNISECTTNMSVIFHTDFPPHVGSHVRYYAARYSRTLPNVGDPGCTVGNCNFNLACGVAVGPLPYPVARSPAIAMPRTATAGGVMPRTLERPMPRVAPWNQPVAQPKIGDTDVPSYRDRVEKGTTLQTISVASTGTMPRVDNVVRTGVGTHEAKVRIAGGFLTVMQIYGRTMHVVTELDDLVEGIWDALPSYWQTNGAKKSVPIMLMDIYRGYQELDWVEAAKNVAFNQLQDMVIGQVSRNVTKDFVTKMGSPIGPFFGPGF